MASTKIERTLGTPTNIDKWTYSVWVKRASIGADTAIVTARTGTSGPYLNLIFQGNHQLRIYGTDSGGLNDFNYQTTRLFRDTSAFYHIVIGFDNTLAAAGDRCKIYVNGVQETSFAGQDDPASGVSYVFNTSGYTTVIGARTDGSEYYNGVMSHINFVDGTQLTPSSFGETDATDGMWKIKTSPSVTYGNNGFFLKMEDSSNLDLDSSGNSISFTTTGTLTATKDCPDNNMSTLSPLIPFPSGLTISNGNTSIASTASQWAGRYSTLRVFKGKYYVEAQFVSTGDNFKFGVQGADPSETTNWSTLNTSYAGYSAVGYEFQCNNGNGYKVNNNSSPRWTESDFTPATSTIMMAFDLDNGKIWWGRNGTWFDSGGTPNPATGTDAAFTGITTANGPYLFGLSLEGNGSSSNINFGNGYYASTAIGSPVTANEGTWAYAPPTGFGAVNTNWINTF